MGKKFYHHNIVSYSDLKTQYKKDKAELKFISDLQIHLFVIVFSEECFLRCPCTKLTKSSVHRRISLSQ